MKLILHLGTYKTATTSFQDFLGDHVPELAKERAYFPVLKTRYKTMGEIHSYLNSDGSNKNQLAGVAESFKQAYFDFKKEDYDKVVISEEMLLGGMQNGPQLHGPRIDRFFEILEAASAEIKFESIKVVYVVREMRSLLESYYIHNLSCGFTKQNVNQFYKNINLKKVSWKPVIRAFCNQNIVNDVVVLNYEIIYSGKEAYFKELAKQCEVNPELFNADNIPASNPSTSYKGAQLCKAIWKESESLGIKRTKVTPVVNRVRKLFPKDNDHKNLLADVSKHDFAVTAKELNGLSSKLTLIQ